MQIYVQSKLGKRLTLDVSRDDSIAKVKQKIADIVGVSIAQQRLVYNDKELEDNRNLSDYKIDKGSIIYFDLRVKGTIEFKAPDVELNTMIKPGRNSYKYYYVKPGLNYGGKCEQDDCKVHGEKVICHRGFGTFDVGSDKAFNEVILCPGCKKPFQLELYFIYQADATIKYKKKGEKTQKIPKVIQGDDIWKLGQNNNDFSDDAEYEALQIICKELPKGK